MLSITLCGNGTNSYEDVAAVFFFFFPRVFTLISENLPQNSFEMKQALAGALLYFFILFMWNCCLYKLHFTLVEQFWVLWTKENQWNLGSIKPNCKTLVAIIGPGFIPKVKKKKKCQETTGQKSNIWECPVSGENWCKDYININSTVVFIIMGKWDSDLLKLSKDM